MQALPLHHTFEVDLGQVGLQGSLALVASHHADMVGIRVCPDLGKEIAKVVERYTIPSSTSLSQKGTMRPDYL